MTFDPEPFLSQLKDFQRASAAYVFSRMYDQPAPSIRFLLADEVGLGKTLVARGVVAKAIAHLHRQGVERVDVVYICSNAEIARQNIQRLNVMGVADELRLPDRLTMLPIHSRRLAEGAVNFISFTPGTSFELKGNLGVWRERAMLHLMLRSVWGADRVKGRGAARIFQGSVKKIADFEARLKEFRRNHEGELDASLVEAFHAAIDERSEHARQEGEPGLADRFDELRERFRYARVTWPEPVLRDRRELVGELRALLARACVNQLEPDLIILDEFQRFKRLLHGDDSAAELARELFGFVDRKTGLPARLLLLSATPYKMFTMSGEAEDDHYGDFVETVGFLLKDPDRLALFVDDLRSFRTSLYLVGADGGAAAKAARARVEETLRVVMARTERLAATEDRSGMLVSRSMQGVEMTAQDACSYVAADRLASTLGVNDPMEFWKSAPYLPNFMEGYRFDGALVKELEDPATEGGLSPHLGEGTLLDWEAIRRYQKVDPGNARLRGLFRDITESGAWRLLWLPAALPYYTPAGPYAETGGRGLTKRLIFSSWNVVPRAIATMLSYEVERRIMTRSRGDDFQNTIEARDGLRNRLAFAYSAGRLTGMPVLALVYPGFALASLADPHAVARRLGASSRPVPIEEVLEAVEEELRVALEPVVAMHPTDGPVDERWYWAAPLLLDAEEDRRAADDFLDSRDLASAWQAEDDSGRDVGEQFRAHLEEARRTISGRLDPPLGRVPEDLARVTAQLALAAPGVTCLRALSRITSADLSDVDLRRGASRSAWGLRALFNTPEATELVRGEIEAGLPYWRRVLEYCVDGNLQAVLDEFAHVLPEFRGLVDARETDMPKLIQETARAMHDAAALRTVQTRVREIDGARGRVSVESAGMRNHFALRLADEKGTEPDERTRASEVRSAFNSPFWPFVLATTSVGQEGLDFHLYCHAVVHWNLPSNPVDLEQREGRVHRYKGHAIRKNVALRFASAAWSAQSGDPWQAMFELGVQSRDPGANDLVPFWVQTAEGGASIERYVLSPPLSREIGRAVALQRTLAAYRLALGQPRQEDLVAYLQNSLDPETLARLVDELRIDLAPR